jgi:glycosyltransferase involved in cell wall biosynthesis
MANAKRIFMISDTKDYIYSPLAAGYRRRGKGFIRLGHDVHVFDFGKALMLLAPVKSKLLSRRWCKPQVDELLLKQAKDYDPHIIFVDFAKYIDCVTIELLRDALPNAFFIAADNDLWPELHENRVEVASKLDIVMTTYTGKGLQAYEEAGVNTIFMPNMCDPDVEYRYRVPDELKCNLIFTGKIRQKHDRYPTDDLRSRVIKTLLSIEGSRFYGSSGRNDITGSDYLRAISGAKIGLSINALNDIRLYHSIRITQYLACGTMVLSANVPDSELLFKDGVHLRYFNSEEEFIELANWYLEHEEERMKIANAGMEYAHAEFNGDKIAKYTMDIIENGAYDAPWSECLR